MMINNKNQWWENIEEADLIENLQLYIHEIGNKSLSIEEVGLILSDNFNKDSKLAFSGNLWLTIKQEFCILICTNDKKYIETRKSLITVGKDTKTVIVAIISASIGSSLGIIAGIVTPFCMLCLFALLHVGKEAFCINNNFEELQLPKSKTKKRKRIR